MAEEKGGFRIDDRPRKLHELSPEEVKEILERYEDPAMIKPEE